MKLDAYQEAAARTDHRRVLVTAPPGSGKTSTLISRLRYMTDEQHCTPSRIACITFTRMAAREIRERVGDHAQGMFIGTLHGFCLRMLMRMGKELGYEQDWLTVISDEEAELDQKEVLANLGFIKRKTQEGKYDWIKVGAGAWEAFTNGVMSGALERLTANPEQMKLWEAWDAIMQRFRSQNLLTYGTILTEAYRLLERPEALAYFQDQHRNILVDEAQDTSHVQWSIVFRLAAKANPDSLWIVGDMDQSLYSWRGAVPDKMLEIANDPTVERHSLQNSYRFGPGISDVAQNLIRHNKTRIDVPIIPKGRTEGRVTSVNNATPMMVTGLVRQLLKAHNAKDIAVLCRAHRPLDVLSKALTAAGVAHTRIGKLNAMRKTGEFRAVMGYLRLAANPTDRRAFMAITASEHLTDEDILKIRKLALNTRVTMAQAYQKMLPKDLQEIEKHLRIIDPQTDYSKAIDYLTVAAHWNSLTTPAEIVNYVALADIQDEVEMARDGLILCTGHAAKGLEWPVVLMIGMNDGICPSQRNTDEHSIEEERRIAYVMLTRAKDEAYLIHLGEGWDERVNGQMFFGKIDSTPSQFLQETLI